MPADPTRLAAAYRLDRARAAAAPRAAEVRGRVGRVARTLGAAAGALADLEQHDRSLLDLSAADVHALHDHLDGLSRRAADADADLKARCGRGGNRRLFGVLGAPPPRARLLLQLRREMPGASRAEILDAAAEVLISCDESTSGLEDVLARLPQNRAK